MAWPVYRCAAITEASQGECRGSVVQVHEMVANITYWGCQSCGAKYQNPVKLRMVPRR